MPNTRTFKFATFNLLNYTAPPYSFYQLHERYNNTQWLQKQLFVANFLSESTHQQDQHVGSGSLW